MHNVWEKIRAICETFLWGLHSGLHVSLIFFHNNIHSLQWMLLWKKIVGVFSVTEKITYKNIINKVQIKIFLRFCGFFDVWSKSEVLYMMSCLKKTKTMVKTFHWNRPRLLFSVVFPADIPEPVDPQICQAMCAIMKLSFEEEYRRAMNELGWWNTFESLGFPGIAVAFCWGSCAFFQAVCRWWLTWSTWTRTCTACRTTPSTWRCAATQGWRWRTSPSETSSTRCRGAKCCGGFGSVGREDWKLRVVMDEFK